MPAAQLTAALVRTRLLIALSREAILRSRGRLADSASKLTRPRRTFDLAWKPKTVSEEEGLELVRAAEAAAQQQEIEQEVRCTLRSA